VGDYWRSSMSSRCCYLNGVCGNLVHESSVKARDERVEKT